LITTIFRFWPKKVVAVSAVVSRFLLHLKCILLLLRHPIFLLLGSISKSCAVK